MSVRPLELVRGLLSRCRESRCAACPLAAPTQSRRVLLFGSPNVGKSVIFSRLTGSYAIVSNYPGTTVEVARGQARIGDVAVEVVDSPGSYALMPFSEDERAARDLLLSSRPHIVVHVVDAKHLRRMLPLTFQLIETGLPVVLDVNIIDEAARAGLQIDTAALSRALGIPVVATAAASGIGMDRLRAILSGPVPEPSSFAVRYPPAIESAVQRIAELLDRDTGVSARSLALLLLQRDAAMLEQVRAAHPEAADAIERIIAETESQYAQPLTFPIAVARQREADRVVDTATSTAPRPVRPGFAEVLGRLTMQPVTGLLALAAVLYVGLYLVVGKLGAGVLVDFIDNQLFVRHINPAVEAFVERILPWPTWSALFVGDYGVFTLGLRYALAIVLPLVGAFFFVFALLEDSGYLPRLALLVDRLFKRIGLSGRAIIPIVLGLGCDTMATLVTRVLQTRRERLIATFLLALAIPCSAQLGVILGLLSGHPRGLVIWGGVVLGVFALSGYLAARVLPGEASRFYLEVPPLRLPSVHNVLTKTYTRLRWYAAEVVPLFLLASVLIWVANLLRLFPLVLSGARPLVRAIGLPEEVAEAFLFGFFRRDYGAARIFDLHSGHAISGVSLVVAMVTITLFIPCIAQFMIMVRERGLRAALAMTAIILPFAFGVGYVLNLILLTLQVSI